MTYETQASSQPRAGATLDELLDGQPWTAGRLLCACLQYASADRPDTATILQDAYFVWSHEGPAAPRSSQSAGADHVPTLSGSSPSSRTWQRPPARWREATMQSVHTEPQTSAEGDRTWTARALDAEGGAAGGWHHPQVGVPGGEHSPGAAWSPSPQRTRTGTPMLPTAPPPLAHLLSELDGLGRMSANLLGSP
jgi:hypothetical protein